MILVPPNVTITGCSDVDEGQNCTMTCNAFDGNPEQVLSYQWQFKANFADEFSDMLQNGSSLSIDNIAYYKAGQYKCEVTTRAGTAQHSIKVEVKCESH